MNEHPTDGADLIQLYLHVRVLLSMVIGLGLTHLLRHFARMVEPAKRKQVYWVHLVWALSMFLFLLHFWWWEFRLSAITNWTFNLYLFVTMYALILYLLCALLFPENLDDYRDYREYYYARRHWFFGVLALAYVIDMADTVIKGSSYFHSFGTEYVVRNCAYVASSVIAIATRNAWYHGSFAVLGIVYQFSWIARLFETLR